jgi:hypothetical protein
VPKNQSNWHSISVPVRLDRMAPRSGRLIVLAILQVALVGGRSAWSNERTEGEGSDTANKDLPPHQVELIDAVTALGKPTIAVISMGGPYVPGG